MGKGEGGRKTGEEQRGWSAEEERAKKEEGGEGGQEI
jgi:hypothetical protein